jgi:hypothetical protein
MTHGVLECLDRVVGVVFNSHFYNTAHGQEEYDVRSESPKPPADLTRYEFPALAVSGNQFIYIRVQGTRELHLHLNKVPGTLNVTLTASPTHKYIEKISFSENINFSENFTLSQETTIDFVFESDWKVVGEKSDAINNIPSPALDGRLLTFYCYNLDNEDRQRKVVITIKEGESF